MYRSAPDGAESAAIGECIAAAVAAVQEDGKTRRAYIHPDWMPRFLVLPPGVRMTHISGVEWEFGVIEEVGRE